MITTRAGSIPLLPPVLRGCGQMLFQPSARTGVVFLALVWSQSTFALLLCLLGVLGGTLGALWLEAPGRAYDQGEGGFNGGLLGLALATFHGDGGALLVLALAGGVLTAGVRALLLRALPVPPYTAPFILVGWLAFIAGGELPGDNVGTAGPLLAWHGQALATNASQVLFLEGPWRGVLVLAAVWLHSGRAVLWLAVASLIAWWTALAFRLPMDLIAAGLLGYNALILAAALAHRRPRRVLCIGGVMVSVLLSWLFYRIGVTPLSAPFVLCAWLVIAAQHLLTRRTTAN